MPQVSKLPLMVSEIGIDAYDINCRSPDTPDVLGCEDQEMQANWLLSLVEDIERHSSACVVGCAPPEARVMIGGAIIGWADELWKGRVIDAVEFDNRSDAIGHLCPDPWANRHTPCGYPSPTQPDTYVNEEWFGILTSERSCANRVDRLRARTAWHRLRFLWKDGGCLGFYDRNGTQQVAVNWERNFSNGTLSPQVSHFNISAPYNLSIYPLCAASVHRLRADLIRCAPQLKEAQEKGNASLVTTDCRTASLVQWDGTDCELQAFLAGTEECPPVPPHMTNISGRVSAAKAAWVPTPEECPTEGDLWLKRHFGKLILPICAVLLLAIFNHRYVSAALCCVCVKLRKRGLSAAARRAAKGGRPHRRRGSQPPPSARKSVGTGPEELTRPSSQKPLFEQLEACLHDPPPRQDMVSAATRERRDVAVREILRPIGEQCAVIFGLQTSQSLPNPTGGPSTPVNSNLDNQVDHLVSLLSQRLDRQEGAGALPMFLAIALERAASELHDDIFDGYMHWVSKMHLRRRTPASKDQITVGSFAYASGEDFGKKRTRAADRCACNMQLHRMMLFMLVWGEAANLRHLPECLCLIFYCASNALLLTHPAHEKPEEEAPTAYSPGPIAVLSPLACPDGGPFASLSQPSFLDTIVCPVYNFLAHEVLKRRDEEVSRRVMYDDVNETFWDPARMRVMVPSLYAHNGKQSVVTVYAELRRCLCEKRLQRFFRKTYREKISWLHAISVYRRICALHLVALHVMISLAANDGVWDWRYMSTSAVTYALFSSVMNLVTLWTGPPCTMRACMCSLVRASLHLCVAALFFVELYVCELSAEWLGARSAESLDVEGAANACFSFITSTTLDRWVYGHGRNLTGTAGESQASSRRSLAHDSGADISLLHTALHMRSLFEVTALVYGLLVSVGLVWPNIYALVTWPCASPLYRGVTFERFGTRAAYSLLWVLILASKFAFEYFLVIKPAWSPSKCLWRDVGPRFYCWQYDAGGNPCSLFVPNVTLFDPDTNQITRYYPEGRGFGDAYPEWGLGEGAAFDDWADTYLHVIRSIRAMWYRVMLLAVRCATPCILIFADTAIFYNLYASLCSFCLATRRRVYHTHSWSTLVRQLPVTVRLFNDRILAPRRGMAPLPRYPRTLEWFLHESPAWNDRIQQHEPSIEACSTEWRAFASAWNRIILTLRADDYLANYERDELMFEVLKDDLAHQHLGAQYVVLPTMLTAPVFTSSMWRHSVTAYPSVLRTLLQARDLAWLILVQIRAIQPDRLGLRWEPIGRAQPARGGEFDNEALVEAMQHKAKLSSEGVWSGVHFTPAELDELGVSDLPQNAYVKLVSNPGGAIYYRPVPDDTRQQFLGALTCWAEQQQARRASRRAGDPGPLPKVITALKAFVQQLVDVQEELYSLDLGSEETTIAPQGAGASLHSGDGVAAPEATSAASRKDHARAANEQMVSKVAQALVKMLVALEAADEDHNHRSRRSSLRSTLARRLSGTNLTSTIAETSTRPSGQRPKALPKRPGGVSDPLGALRRLISDGGPLTNDGLVTTLSSKIVLQDLVRCPTPLLALHRSLTSTNPGSEPKNAEARRQLLFFCNSLHNAQLRQPQPISQMRSWTAFTPHYSEDVALSCEALQQSNDESATLLTILQALHPDEWNHLCERVSQPNRLDGVDKGFGAASPELSKLSGMSEAEAKRLCEPSRLDMERWASHRSQVLSRTVHGVMRYGAGLKELAKLEGIPADDAACLANSKFEYIVTCQMYGVMKTSKDPSMKMKASQIDALRAQYPESLRIAYVELPVDDEQPEVRSSRDAVGCSPNSFFSVLMGWRKAAIPGEYHDCMLYKVRLPGNPILGEGKPENQNHAIIFTRGEHLQTLDMNQDNYMGESYKMRNLLECFRDRVRIVGFREHIFSESGGAVAKFAASNEFVFGTMVQRFLTWPLMVRFHYGHPDVWDKVWVMGNGGVSKASRTLHVSEDIFGGVNVVLRGGHIEYLEYIHCGKARDITFTATNAFEQKVSGGNAFQGMSRDLARLGKQFDLFRLLSMFATGTGLFISSALIFWALYWFVVSIALLALVRLERFSGGAEDGECYIDAISSSGDTQVYASQWFLQMGFILMLPLFLECVGTVGILSATKELLGQLLSGKILFTLFQERTRVFYLNTGFTLGSARYVATGRSFVTMSSNFVLLYSLYARSHFLIAAELSYLSTIFLVFTESGQTLALIKTWPVWLVVLSMVLSPWFFNPRAFQGISVYNNLEEFLAWLDPGSELSRRGKGWARWHADTMRVQRRAPLSRKAVIILSQKLFPQLCLFTTATAALYINPIGDGSRLNFAIFRSWLTMMSAVIYLLVGLVYLQLAYPRFLSEIFRNWRVLQAAYLWGLRIGALYGFLHLVWLLFGDYMSSLKELDPVQQIVPYERNSRAIIVSSVSVHIGLIQVLGFISENPRRCGLLPRPLLRGLRVYSDRWYREADAIIGQMIGVVLLTLGVLPFGFIHSKLLFNQVYAASLERLQRQRELLLLVSGISISPTDLHTVFRFVLACLKAIVVAYVRFLGWMLSLCGLRDTVIHLLEGTWLWPEPKVELGYTVMLDTDSGRFVPSTEDIHSRPESLSAPGPRSGAFLAKLAGPFDELRQLGVVDDPDVASNPGNETESANCDSPKHDGDESAAPAVEPAISPIDEPSEMGCQFSGVAGPNGQRNCDAADTSSGAHTSFPLHSLLLAGPSRLIDEPQPAPSPMAPDLSSAPTQADGLSSLGDTPGDAAAEAIHPLPPNVGAPPGALPDNWKAYEHGGHTFYYNCITNVSQWEPPIRAPDTWVHNLDGNGRPVYVNVATGERSWKRPQNFKAPLPGAKPLQRDERRARGQMALSRIRAAAPLHDHACSGETASSCGASNWHGTTTHRSSQEERPQRDGSHRLSGHSESSVGDVRSIGILSRTTSMFRPGQKATLTFSVAVQRSARDRVAKLTQLEDVEIPVRANSLTHSRPSLRVFHGFEGVEHEESQVQQTFEAAFKLNPPLGHPPQSLTPTPTPHS